MKTKEIKIRKTIYSHVINNKKEYIVVALIFIVGIFLGVLFVNNIKDNQKQELASYINDFTEKMKTSDNIDSMSVLSSSIKQKILLALCIWFFGTTVIRNTNSFWNCII